MSPLHARIRKRSPEHGEIGSGIAHHEPEALIRARKVRGFCRGDRIEDDDETGDAEAWVGAL